MSTDMPRWEVTIKFAKPPTYTCEVLSFTECIAKRLGRAEAINAGFQSAPVNVTAKRIEHEPEQQT